MKQARIDLPAFGSTIPGLGALAQICAGSTLVPGRTSLLFSKLAELTGNDYFCALVDPESCLDPLSAKSAGVKLDRLLWVRCGSPARDAQKGSSERFQSGHKGQNSHRNEQCNSHKFSGKKLSPSEIKQQRIQKARGHHETQIEKAVAPKHRRLDVLERAFKATDILVQNGGFEMVAVDLSNIEERHLRKVPLTTWFRFARVAEKTQTSLVFLTGYPAAHLCAAATLQINFGRTDWGSGINPIPQKLCTAMSVREQPQFKSAHEGSGVLQEEQVTIGQSQRALSVSISNRQSVPAEDDSSHNFHMNVFDGIECEIGIAHRRKPAQKAQSKFKTETMWQ